MAYRQLRTKLLNVGYYLKSQRRKILTSKLWNDVHLNVCSKHLIITNVKIMIDKYFQHLLEKNINKLYMK